MSTDAPKPDLHAQVQALPKTPGVYSFYDADERLLYIGKSVNVRARVRSYLRPDGGHSRRTARLKDEAVRVEAQVCGSELEALLVESKAIKRLQPLYNIRGRTYQHYPFIKIPDEPFPRVQLTYQLEDDGGRYYGPFPSEFRAREALEAMRPLFRWRSCQPLASRECFEHAIGRCSAPCVGKVDAAGYAERLAELERFLTGEGDRQLQALERRMTEAAEALEFERARILRDRLAMLRPLVWRQSALQAAISELDCLVVLPAATPGKSLWLVVRRGRLVHTEPDVSPRKRRGLVKRLEAVMAPPPPSLTVHQHELDEINIIAGWLHRHRESEGAIPLAGRSMAEAVEAGLAFMRQGARPAQVAERAPERVEPGPAGA